MWLDDDPSLLKGFLEQVMRRGFAFAYLTDKLPENRFAGGSGCVILTVGMPELFYRLVYRAGKASRSVRVNSRWALIGPGACTELERWPVGQCLPDRRIAIIGIGEEGEMSVGGGCHREVADPHR